VKKEDKTAASWPVRVVILVALLALAFFGIREYSANKYGTDLHNAIYYITTSADELEDAGIQFLTVWNNSLYRIEDEKTDRFTREENGTGLFYEDFNDALALLLEDSDYNAALREADRAQREAAALMANLTNPPRRYEDAYRQLKTLYADYMEFYDLVNRPHGNFESFSTCFDDVRNRILKDTYALSMY